MKHTLDQAAIFERLQKHFGPQIAGGGAEPGDPWIEVPADRLAEISLYLRDERDLRFDFLHCISSVDYFEPDPKKAAKIEWTPHLEVLYHLSSMVHRHRVVLKVMLPRWKGDQPGQLPEVPSVSHIWSTANWHEREVYDLGGVYFVGHPDLRRILCPEDWAGHPLRKDYETPEEYHGIRVR
jgi:NADH-quinone oxidoreductase subunit C